MVWADDGGAVVSSTLGQRNALANSMQQEL
jgi:hypothetical protein